MVTVAPVSHGDRNGRSRHCAIRGPGARLWIGRHRGAELSCGHEPHAWNTCTSGGESVPATSGYGRACGRRVAARPVAEPATTPPPINRIPVGEVLIGEQFAQPVTHPHGRRAPRNTRPRHPHRQRRNPPPEPEPIDIAATPPTARTTPPEPAQHTAPIHRPTMTWLHRNEWRSPTASRLRDGAVELAHLEAAGKRSPPADEAAPPDWGMRRRIRRCEYSDRWRLLRGPSEVQEWICSGPERGTPERGVGDADQATPTPA
ncbi:hypothetical protein SO3561_08679 [Streptomyces olivochromogenes]|uniref:Uncharacterized protein n=1 Tax=Streptomyces olivochromogenes TaxID=1963 RepID=A0A250VSN6_STROL|nr:hypothetical protein SO3561_08679 [Streptomyces olivochromogenes]